MKLAALPSFVITFGKFAGRKQKRHYGFKKPGIEMHKITCKLVNQFAE